VNARCGLTAVQDEFDGQMIHFEHHYGDTFEIPETAQRSEWYDVTSHPHVRFDGLNPVIGALNCLAAGAEYRERVLARLEETGGLSPVEITGYYELTPDQVSISATYRLVDPGPMLMLQASLLIYEDNVYWCCGAGGNDTWQHVTRRIHDEEITFADVNDEVTVTATIPIDPEWDPGELHMIAYLQETETKEIIQGHIVMPLAASTPEIEHRASTRIDAVTPNPFRSSALVSFKISSTDASEPVLLQVFDPSGRRVADLFDGNLAPGPHVVRWDRASPGGDRRGSGLYFVRLSTRQGTHSARLVGLN